MNKKTTPRNKTFLLKLKTLVRTVRIQVSGSKKAYLEPNSSTGTGSIATRAVTLRQKLPWTKRQHRKLRELSQQDWHMICHTFLDFPEILLVEGDDVALRQIDGSEHGAGPHNMARWPLVHKKTLGINRSKNIFIHQPFLLPHRLYRWVLEEKGRQKPQILGSVCFLCFRYLRKRPRQCEQRDHQSVQLGVSHPLRSVPQVCFPPCDILGEM